jgi:hypothetical protein
MRSSSGADPAQHPGDKLIVGGVVTPVSIGQEILPQRLGGSVGAD